MLKGGIDIAKTRLDEIPNPYPKNEEISLDYDNDIYLRRIIYKALGLLSWNKNLKKVNIRLFGGGAEHERVI